MRKYQGYYKLVYHPKEKSLKWWVEAPLGKTPVARFEFPLEAQGFMHIHAYLQGQKVKKHVKEFYEAEI